MDKESQQIAGEYGVWLTMVSQREVPHLSDQAIEAAIKRWSEHERDAREHGIPGLGSGNIYRFPQSKLFVPGFPIPDHWPRAWALDVGWNWTAALWFTKAMAPLIDGETDETQEQRDKDPAWTTGRIYIYKEYKKGKMEPFQHAEEIKTLHEGLPLPGVIDPSANHPSKRDGKQLLKAYRSLGLQLHKASNSVEGGIINVRNMLNAGQIQVFNTCSEFRKEYRSYRRDLNGNVIKKNDHLMDDLRYFVLSGIDLLHSGVKEPNPDQQKQWEKNQRQTERLLNDGAWMV